MTSGQQVKPDNEYFTTQLDEASQVMIVTLERQGNVKNQLGTGIHKPLLAILAPQLEKPTWRGLILRSGREKVFSAGADIEGDLVSLTKEEAIWFSTQGHEVFSLLRRIRCVSVVLISGFCLGGGLELALACDFRIAAKQSRLGLPEVDLGLIPGWGGTQRLPRLIGMRNARRMIMSGMPINSTLALEYGLVDEIVDDYASLLPAGKKLVSKFSAKSGTALMLVRRALYEGIEMTLEDGMQLETDLFAEAWDSPDRAEGIAAFIEKRKPKWQT